MHIIKVTKIGKEKSRNPTIMKLRFFPTFWEGSREKVIRKCFVSVELYFQSYEEILLLFSS